MEENHTSVNLNLPAVCDDYIVSMSLLSAGP